MVQADMGVGMMPDRAFDVIGRGMGLRSIRLRDTWARRQLKLAVRQARLLSRTGRLVFEHLREAEGAGEAAAVC
jgi:DNA-binding transcriptional LysR family regulator